MHNVYWYKLLGFHCALTTRARAASTPPHCCDDARIDWLWMVRASAFQAPTTAHHNLLPLIKLLGTAKADRSLEIDWFAALQANC